jgi:hypothetical protein
MWLVENRGKRISKVKAVVFNGSTSGQLNTQPTDDFTFFYSSGDGSPELGTPFQC